VKARREGSVGPHQKNRTALHAFSGAGAINLFSNAKVAQAINTLGGRDLAFRRIYRPFEIGVRVISHVTSHAIAAGAVVSSKLGLDRAI